MRIMLLNIALEAAPTGEGVPWPWYAAAVVGGVGLIAYLVKVFVRPVEQAQSGKWVPRATVDMMMKAKDDELGRKDTDHAREIEGVRRDLADWRTAYHLAAEVGKVQSSQLDEIVEGYRMILAVVQALPKVQSTDRSEVNNRAGAGQ